MGIKKKYWEFGGAILLFGVSLMIFSPNVMNIWVPMPIYLVILAWVATPLTLFLTPALYLLSTKLSGKSKYFSIITISMIVIFAILNLWYFYGSYSYGIKYQGLEHTQIVFIENIVGFGVALLLAAWSHFRKSQAGTYAANLIFFILLSWCAFPYLGEMP